MCFGQKEKEHGVGLDFLISKISLSYCIRHSTSMVTVRYTENKTNTFFFGVSDGRNAS